MKIKIYTSLIFLFAFLTMNVFAQDTLIVAKNYKYKIGIKGLFERSGLYTVIGNDPEALPVYSFGVQVISKFGNSKSSLESGLYYLSRASNLEYRYYGSFGYYGFPHIPFWYRNIHLPVNYRLDTKIIYFAVGLYGDYLVRKSAREFDGFIESYGTDRKFNLGFNLNLGFEKPFSKTLCLFVEAGFSYNLTSFRKEDDFFIYNSDRAFGFTNYGVNFGINYKFLRKK